MSDTKTPRQVQCMQACVETLANLQQATASQVLYRYEAHKFAPGLVANCLKLLEDMGTVVQLGPPGHYSLTAIYLRLSPGHLQNNEQSALTKVARDQAATLMQTMYNLGVLDEEIMQEGNQHGELHQLLTITLVGFANSMYPQLLETDLDGWRIKEV